MTLLEAARRDIEHVLWCILGVSPPQHAVEFALRDLLSTSDISQGRYSPDDVTLSIRRTLVEAVQALGSAEALLGG